MALALARTPSDLTTLPPVLLSSSNLAPTTAVPSLTPALMLTLSTTDARQRTTTAALDTETSARVLTETLAAVK